MQVLDHTPVALDTNLLLAALEGFHKGDFTSRLPVSLSGSDARIAELINGMIEDGERRAQEDIAIDVLDARQLVNALVALRRGDFSVRLPSDLVGMNGKIADTLNDIIENSDKRPS